MTAEISSALQSTEIDPDLEDFLIGVGVAAAAVFVWGAGMCIRYLYRKCEY